MPHNPINPVSLKADGPEQEISCVFHSLCGYRWSFPAGYFNNIG